MPEALPANMERRPCECKCGKTFVVPKRSPRMFFSRGCAARHNAGSFKRPRHYRRQTAGVKERGMSGMGSIAVALRKYEDERIAAGKMAPRKSLRELHTQEVNAAKRRRALKKNDS
jgi:hypothetical protein